MDQFQHLTSGQKSGYEHLRIKLELVLIFAKPILSKKLIRCIEGFYLPRKLQLKV